MTALQAQKQDIVKKRQAAEAERAEKEAQRVAKEKGSKVTDEKSTKVATKAAQEAERQRVKFQEKEQKRLKAKVTLLYHPNSLACVAYAIHTNTIQCE